MDQDVQVRTLNSLLASLEIPLVLQTPLELSPPLILMMFESMLRTHLSVSSETRKCKTHAARVDAMKIFIGVLEDDVLGIDVGLGEIDPRRLAEGRKEEVLRVAEILCWLGKRMNYVSQDGLSIGNVARSREYTANEVAGSRPNSPSMLSAMSTGHDSSLLVESTRGFDDSLTTVTTQAASEDISGEATDEHTFSFLDHLSPLHRESRELVHPEHTHVHEEGEDERRDVRSVRKPLRRYDFDSDESDIEDSYCHCASDLSTSTELAPPIRTTGYLKRVDFQDELRIYEARRSKSRSRDVRRHLHGEQSTPHLSSPVPLSPGGIITRHTSPLRHSLALLDERARLLAELSRLRHNRLMNATP